MDNPYGPNGEYNVHNRQLSEHDRHRLNLNHSTDAELHNMVNIITSMDFNHRDAERIYRTLLNIDNDAQLPPMWVMVPLHPVHALDTEEDTWLYEKGSYQAKLLTMIDYINSLRFLTGKRNSRKGKRNSRKGKRNSRKGKRNSRKHF